jgi:hypothetical protein
MGREAGILARKPTRECDPVAFYGHRQRLVGDNRPDPRIS